MNKEFSASIIDAVVMTKVERWKSRIVLKLSIFKDGSLIANEVRNIHMAMPMDMEYNIDVCMNTHWIVNHRIARVCFNKGITPAEVNIVWISNSKSPNYRDINFPQYKIVSNYISDVEDGYSIRSNDPFKRLDFKLSYLKPTIYKMGGVSI